MAAAREALGEDHNNPTAMVLATVDRHGHPNARVVLCRGFDATHGTVRFYTDRSSAKGQELTDAPHAALVFYWEPLYRQVRIRGPVRPAPDAESDAYFDARPIGARVSASVSRQSAPVSSRAELLAAHEQLLVRATAPGSRERVARPERWGGFDIVITELELWAGRRDRLHDRARYTRDPSDAAGAPTKWRATRLQP